MKFTGLYDKKNQPINVGDVVYSDYDYYLMVEEAEEGNFYGRLICSEDNGCKNIPYHLGDGSTLTKTDPPLKEGRILLREALDVFLDNTDSFDSDADDNI